MVNTLEEAKYILGLLAGKESGFTTATQTRDAARTILEYLAEEPEWEYGTRRSVTDGWERGDTYGEHEYIDARSISDNINEDRSTTRPRRDMTRAVRRRKAGPWEPVKN